MAAEKTAIAPTLDCECGALVTLDGKRIGDSIVCTACGKMRVVIRSKVKGEVPPASGAQAQASDRRAEVQASLERIRIRRAGRAARDIALYPTWAILLGGWVFGAFLGGFLAAQNMVALGRLSAARAGRSVFYLALAHAGLFLLYLGFKAGTFDAFHVPPDAAYPALRQALRIGAVIYVIGVVLVLPVALAVGAAPATNAARQAGARSASPVLPFLVGFLLLIGQLFAAKFIALAARPW